MKVENKRIKDDDFQELVKCSICPRLFWAISVYELGDWQNNCRICRGRLEEEEKKRQQNIRENGRKIIRNEQTYAWELESEIVFNEDYTYPTLKNSSINSTNIDDIIREQKKKGTKSITWHPYLFDLLLHFQKVNGFVAGIESPIKYMGVNHTEGKAGNYEFETK